MVFRQFEGEDRKQELAATPGSQAFLAHGKMDYGACVATRDQDQRAATATEGSDGHDTCTDSDEDDSSTNLGLSAGARSTRPAPMPAAPRPIEVSEETSAAAKALHEEAYAALIKDMNASLATASSCGRPQASHADDTTITLSWKPPAGAMGLDLLKYEIQFCLCDESGASNGSASSSPRKRSKGGVGDWKPIFNPVGDVRGSELGPLYICSWVVKGLMTGRATCLRVRVTNVKAYSEWSEPSRPFSVGACTYTAAGPGPGGDRWTEDEMELFLSLNTPAKVGKTLVLSTPFWPESIGINAPKL